ncbi:MAG: heparan-alpha-glucosaminide N-acetyltransferase domain-containing protein [Spirulinaceae cyanobacterium]
MNDKSNLQKTQRLTSIDVFRGMAIAGMILVNNPGSWEHVYAPLLHAEWHGFTPTDFVFPAFLFIAGTSIAFSLAKYIKEEKPPQEVYLRLLKRCLILFALGLFLNASSLVMNALFKGESLSELANLRIMGVLQRISLAYFFAGIAVLNLNKKALWILSGVILLGYWGAMMLIPVPNYGAGNLSLEGNLATYIDRLVLGTKHLYINGFDPEGLFSTLPAIVTVWLGYFAGDWIRHQPIKSRTTIGLVLFGIAALFIGWFWGLVFPLNKQLWTSSYVLYSAGWASLLLAACYELIEVRNIRSWSFPFKVMGMNAIFIFVLSGFIVRILYRTNVGSGEDAPTTYAWIYETFFASWAGEINGSLLFALVSVAFWWLILYFMYRQRWFIKV